MEVRKVKMVNIETQTDLMDISSADCTPSPCLASRNISSTLRQSNRSPSPPTVRIARNISTRTYCQSDQQHQSNETPQPLPATIDCTSPTNGNGMTESAIDTTDVVMSNSDLTYHDACSSPDEQLIDAMNSNERLDMRETCSDDDNLERLDRKVTEFFHENRLSLQSDNGNNGSSALVDGALLSVRRARLSINGDDVTFITHSNGFAANGNIKAMNNYNNDITQSIMVSSVSDQEYDNDDEGDDECYDDSCTDDGDDTDHNNYSLRRRR